MELALNNRIDNIENSISKLCDILVANNQPKQSSYSLYDYFVVWLNEYKAPYVRPYTLQSYKTVIRLHIKPNLANKNLSQYSSIDIQKALNSMPNTRQKECAAMILNDSLTKAYNIGLIDNNIMSAVRLYKHERQQGFAMTKEQQIEFLDKLHGNKLEMFYKFVLYTGCRRGEALSLSGRDIDRASNLLHIKGTKTKQSNRYIPLFSNVDALLKKVCNRNAKVFNFNADYVSKGLEKLGLSFELNLKDLRTTFATRCAESGISDIVIAKWLGHSSTYVTKKHYEKVLDEFESAQAQKLSQAFCTTVTVGQT